MADMQSSPAADMPYAPASDAGAPYTPPADAPYASLSNAPNVSPSGTQAAAKADAPKVLMQLRDVKMYFPIKKDKLFQKGKLFVKAMDGVSVDIYEGETFGLVGESGCGKTTLGRVALQLYKQTSGTVRYRGVTLDDYSPSYAAKDIRKIPSISGSSRIIAQEVSQEMQLRASQPGAAMTEQEAARQAAELTAQFIAKRFPNQASMAGGLLLHDNLSELATLAGANFNAVKKVYQIQTSLNLLIIKRDALLGSGDLSRIEEKRLAGLETKITALSEKLTEAESERARCNAQFANLRNLCVGKPGFDILEALRDVSIDLNRLTKEEMRRQRRHLQIIFQDPYSSLNTRFTVGNIISESVVAHNMYKRGSRQLEEYTLDIMDKCGLANYFIHRYPHQFSGGQRQRIGIARALASQPKFIVCDEAVSALDVSIQSQIINLLKDLKESSNLTYLFISHNLSTVKFISDRVAVMYLGDIIELGDSGFIFDEPLHPYTVALLEAIPTTDEESKKELLVIEGDVPSPINPPPGCKFHTRCKYATDICSQTVPEWREIRPRHWVSCHFPMRNS